MTPIAAATWQARATCRFTDPETFYPVTDTCHTQIEEALAVCRACPVVRECEEYALSIHKAPGDLWGVWAAKTQAQMRRLLADQIRKRTDTFGLPCRRCGEDGLKLDGRRLCVDCFHVARRGRYLSKFTNIDPSLVHEPRPAGDIDRKPPTECGFGHPYTEANTYISPQGKRSCRRCKNGRRTFRAKTRLVEGRTS